MVAATASRGGMERTMCIWSGIPRKSLAGLEARAL
jgi:hypothetical protein